MATQKTDSLNELSSHLIPTPQLILAHSGVPERGALVAVALAMTFFLMTFPGELVNGMFVSWFFHSLSSQVYSQGVTGVFAAPTWEKLKAIQFPGTK